MFSKIVLSVMPVPFVNKYPFATILKYHYSINFTYILGFISESVLVHWSVYVYTNIILALNASQIHSNRI